MAYRGLSVNPRCKDLRAGVAFRRSSSRCAGDALDNGRTSRSETEHKATVEALHRAVETELSLAIPLGDAKEQRPVANLNPNMRCGVVHEPRDNVPRVGRIGAGGDPAHGHLYVHGDVGPK